MLDDELDMLDVAVGRCFPHKSWVPDEPSSPPKKERNGPKQNTFSNDLVGVGPKPKLIPKHKNLF